MGREPHTTERDDGRGAHTTERGDGKGAHTTEHVQIERRGRSTCVIPHLHLTYDQASGGWSSYERACTDAVYNETARMRWGEGNSPPSARETARTPQV